jgi:CubicO group peptidase (beta-lactamase class C family)
MKTFKILLTLLVTIALGTSAIAQDDTAKNKKLNTMIEAGMKDWQIPGLAVVVVKNGEVIYKKAYGVKDMETKEPVNEQTLFSMASTTKAFIAMALGILVDQQKVAWDDKVIDHLPSFQLSDHYITADARVKDLLTHNLGIAQADGLWAMDHSSTKETLGRFKYTKTSYPLRGGFEYQNIMYAVAGELIEAVSGQPWTQFVQQYILTPLDMSRTITTSSEITKAGNYVTPHFNDVDEGLIKIDYTLSDQIGAAGMMWSSISDISKYLNFLVNDGVVKGDTLIKPATFKYLFEPHAFLTDSGVYPTNALTKPNWNTYGLGWFQQDYRGIKLDFHTGSLPGLIALAGIVHEHDLAVYVFANLDHAELRHAILYKAIDLYAFNDDSRNWHDETYKLYQGFKNKSNEARQNFKDKRVQNTKPSLPLDQYVGTYTNDLLGMATISTMDGQLQIDFNQYLKYQLTHWHYDTFITNKDSKFRERNLINFNLNVSGNIKEFEFWGEKFTKQENKKE